jgi:hypothetical protein
MHPESGQAGCAPYGFGDRLLNLEIEKEFAPAPASWDFEVE